MTFTTQQRDALSADLDRKHVASRSQAGRQLSYIEGWHAIAEANRIFGFDGWSSETVALDLVSERERQVGQRQGFGVTYTARVRITVYAGDRIISRDGVGAGHGMDVDPGLAHEKAVKEAETDARKRGLMTFGNPFGLALYDKSQESVSTNVPDAMAPSASRETPPNEAPMRPETQAAPEKASKPSHITAPALDPKAIALRKQEEAAKAAADRLAEGKSLANDWVGSLEGRLDDAKAVATRDELRRIRERHNAWCEVAKVNWKKLAPADQARVRKARIALEDFLKDSVVDEIAAIAKEQAA